MYKITINGKSIVGTNFDAYYLTPTIWLENATNAKTYGAGFSGGRQDGINGISPQSGMNTEGLTFSRLASPTPETGIATSKNKKQITNPTLYLKDILHNCKNVDEVKEYISKYDFSYFLQDVFIYIDKSGKYLVVEPYTMTIGKDAKICFI
jgi:penicillin V acylase-like amidase (Ntn superfamily)